MTKDMDKNKIVTLHCATPASAINALPPSLDIPSSTKPDQDITWRTRAIKSSVGIFTLYLLGMKRADIARLFNFSRQRVTQVVQDYEDIL